ncbi:MAG: hypothetical protein ACK5O2_11785 [Microthrixaceae bacterium]
MAALRPQHRARRFFASLVSSRPDPRDVEWALGHLTEREQVLFSRMRPVDQSHSVAVARAVERAAQGQGWESWVIPAALLHDVGKSVPDLGTYGRVVATLSGWIGGADMANVWADTTGFTRKVGLYLKYPELGADLLAVAGSDERVVAWAREHHLPEEDWTVPAAQGRTLAAADDGRL